MNKLAYTVFVAFVASMLTLIAVHRLVPEQEPGDGEARAGITAAELARHDSAASCWKAIDGQVYDVTAYVENHPTDPEVVLAWCGRDATEAWRNKRPGVPHSARAQARLQAYRVGPLAE